MLQEGAWSQCDEEVGRGGVIVPLQLRDLMQSRINAFASQLLRPDQHPHRPASLVSDVARISKRPQLLQLLRRDPARLLDRFAQDLPANAEVDATSIGRSNAVTEKVEDGEEGGRGVDDDGAEEVGEDEADDEARLGRRNEEEGGGEEGKGDGRFGCTGRERERDIALRVEGEERGVEGFKEDGIGGRSG